jgi:hypothetical protein
LGAPSPGTIRSRHIGPEYHSIRVSNCAGNSARNQRANRQITSGEIECAKQNCRHASTSLKLFGHPVGYDFFKLKIVARAMPSRLASCAAVSFIEFK